MNRTANLTMQVNVDAIDHEHGTARVSLPVPDNYGRYHEMIVPTSALELDDPYDGWTVKTIVSTTPASGAVIEDAHGRPRARFYAEDGESTSGPATARARAFLDHLRNHFPEGI